VNTPLSAYAQPHAAKPLRVLLFSTLYPSSARPLHGIFVETRLRELLRHGQAQAQLPEQAQGREIQARVVAPVPWYWSKDASHGKYAAMANTPLRETRNGIDVRHPRFFTVPKIGMYTAPLMLALGARQALADIQREGFDFDLIDAHYYYPDGVAAALLARWFGKPLVVTARGSDVNLIPNHTVPRKFIQWAARRAQASIGVSAALVERMRQLQFDVSRLHAMRNGVDATRFSPLPADKMRAELGISGAPVVLTVGNLHEHKGQPLVLAAFAQLVKQQAQTWSKATLWIVGEGPDRALLQRSISDLGLGTQVRLVGSVPNAELARWYSAADLLVLASSREGWPNVLLEAMACGTPVVATAVGGIPEVVANRHVGRLVTQRSADGFAAAMQELLAAQLSRAEVRRYAEGFGWDHTSAQQLALFNNLVAAS
jgi:teichuronic acid biosynthesis glycosyltransferase TuaC